MLRKIVAVHPRDAFGRDKLEYIGKTGHWDKKTPGGKWQGKCGLPNGYEWGKFIFSHGENRNFLAISTVPIK